jgi:MFS family permease
MAYLAGTFSLGLGGIVMGYLADRFSTRPVVLAGSICLGASSLLLANQSSLWEFYLYSCLMGGFGSAAIFSPLIVNVGNWFERNKGLAIGLTSAGHALGQGLFIYFARQLISNFGWRETYFILGVVTLLVLVPLAMLIRDPCREPVTGEASGHCGEAIERVGNAISPRLLIAWLGVAAVLCCICMASPIVHVVALVTDRGFDPASAANVLSFVLAAGVLGRIFFGKIADHVGGIATYFIASAGQTVLVFWFTQAHSLAEFYTVAVLFGFAHSGVMTSVFFCVQTLIPVERRGFAQGIITLFASVGMGLGGLQGGIFHDLTGTYVLSFAVSAAAGLINLGVVASLIVHTRKTRRLPAAVPAASMAMA